VAPSSTATLSQSFAPPTIHPSPASGSAYSSYSAEPTMTVWIRFASKCIASAIVDSQQPSRQCRSRCHGVTIRFIAAISHPERYRNIFATLERQQQQQQQGGAVRENEYCNRTTQGKERPASNNHNHNNNRNIHTKVIVDLARNHNSKICREYQQFCDFL
jgi:hypothetical protein